MKVISHKPKNKWYSPTFTIRQITREDLGLILSFARDGLEQYRGDFPIRNLNYENLENLIDEIDAYVHGDETKRVEPLEIPNYGKK